MSNGTVIFIVVSLFVTQNAILIPLFWSKLSSIENELKDIRNEIRELRHDFLQHLREDHGITKASNKS
jgi:hypothetical protein